MNSRLKSNKPPHQKKSKKLSYVHSLFINQLCLLADMLGCNTNVKACTLNIKDLRWAELNLLISSVAVPTKMAILLNVSVDAASSNRSPRITSKGFIKFDRCFIPQSNRRSNVPLAALSKMLGHVVHEDQSNFSQCYSCSTHYGLQ